jgi:hypothetical protein
VADAKFIVRTLQGDRSAAGCVQPNVPHGRTEAVLRKGEIFQCSPHKDAGGVYRPVHCCLGIYQEHTQSTRGEQSGTLQTGETGTNHHHIHAVGH